MPRAESLYRCWHVLWELTRCEFKLRDQGSVFGFCWTLLYPAAMFASLYLIFGGWIGRDVPGYGSFLLVGLLQWNFFVSATSNALTSLRRKAPLIKNFSFPRGLIVISSVLVVGLSYALEMGVLALLLVLVGTPVTWTWALVPALSALLFLWALGLGFALALLGLEFIDTERLWSLGTHVGFFATPVFYATDALPPGIRDWLWLNPLAQFLAAFRACLLEGRPPWASLASLALWATVLALAGGWLFARRSPAIGERLR
ncbi:MAG: ABC transporter permease [Elusimicrobia bacterium]|nr:ABC transporter permease [Elusimicrobiota bacterium]